MCWSVAEHVLFSVKFALLCLDILRTKQDDNNSKIKSTKAHQKKNQNETEQKKKKKSTHVYTLWQPWPNESIDVRYMIAVCVCVCSSFEILAMHSLFWPHSLHPKLANTHTPSIYLQYEEKRSVLNENKKKLKSSRTVNFINEISNFAEKRHTHHRIGHDAARTNNKYVQYHSDFVDFTVIQWPARLQFSVFFCLLFCFICFLDFCVIVHRDRYYKKAKIISVSFYIFHIAMYLCYSIKLER